MYRGESYCQPIKPFKDPTTGLTINNYSLKDLISYFTHNE